MLMRLRGQPRFEELLKILETASWLTPDRGLGIAGWIGRVVRDTKPDTATTASLQKAMFQQLELARAAGYRQWDKLAAMPEFAGLAQQPQWRELTKRAERRPVSTSQ